MNTSPTILAIDSSLGACSVAIWKNNQVSAYCEELTTSNQAKNLLPMVEKALAQSGIAYNDLTAIAVSVGPGSFTGIRIGLSTARAIGFSANLLVSGFSSLQIIAYGIKQEGRPAPILSSLNAGKGETIYQYFSENLAPQSDPILVAQGLAPAQTSVITSPRADLLAALAAYYPDYAVEPLPFYVRPPDAKLPGAAHA